LAQLVKVESIRGSLIADLDSCGLAIDHAAYGRSLALSHDIEDSALQLVPRQSRDLGWIPIT